jgi:signal transduction histidine kinase
VTAADTRASRELDQARRLERGLSRVRSFGVLLGIYLVSQTNSGPPPHATNTVLAAGYALMAGLAVANMGIWLGTRRATTVDAMRKIGVVAFAIDMLVLFALTWVFSYQPNDTTWVVLYILPLEGALRYRLRGALASVALTLVNETARDAYLASRFAGYPFLVSNVVFRAGIQSIIALVAGFMARSLARQAGKAEEEARRAEAVASRETSARRELAAFNTAILTGVAAEDLDPSIRLMAEAIGRDLGFEAFTILLRDGDELVVKGMSGMPFYEDRIPLGQGVTGTCAATGRALIVPDVSTFHGYIQVDPEMRSEMAAPLRIGEEVIGVLDVESRTPDAFDQTSLDVLVRLADQIALVAHSNLLLSQQAETVRRLKELDQMKSDFVAITSHELRTPITAIRGFVSTLLRNQDRLEPDQVASFMAIIDRQSARLARLVEDLLFVSKIEAGALQLTVQEVDLGDFLRECVESIGPDAKARVQLLPPPDGTSAPIDPQRVDQIVRNLVDNALKFSDPDQSVLLEARADADTVTFSITDRGPGIAAQDLPRIFDRFHQAADAMTREREGAGLGLYITKRLVEAMGGTIEVSSELGSGSMFVVRLPRTLRAWATAEGHAMDGRVGQSSQVSAPVGSPRFPEAP